MLVLNGPTLIDVCSPVVSVLRQRAVEKQDSKAATKNETELDMEKRSDEERR
jgi:hypothetical protein